MTRTAMSQHWLTTFALVFALVGRASANDAASGTVSPTIRVGVITQENGPHLGIYFPALAASPVIEKVAVADPSGTTFAPASKQLGRYADFARYHDAETMLGEFQPELVIIALAAHRAPNRIRQALTAGSHVLAEKPACVRAEDFENLVRLADQQKRHLMLALPSRLSPDIRRARQIIDAGWLGKLYGVTFFQVKDQARLAQPSYHQS